MELKKKKKEKKKESPVFVRRQADRQAAGAC